MAELLTRDLIAAKADIHGALPQSAERALPDRNFELPSALYAITFALFIGFVALMGVSFAHPEMILPMAIIAIIVTAFFGVPAMWTGLNPAPRAQPSSWARFQREGIVTATGRTSARDATVQVLILPVLIFFWGVCVVVIAALV